MRLETAESCRACPRLVVHRETIATRARSARGEPNGPRFHRRSLRRLSLRRAASRGSREPTDERASRRRPPIEGRIDHARGALRSSGQPSLSRRDPPLRRALARSRGTRISTMLVGGTFCSVLAPCSPMERERSCSADSAPFSSAATTSVNRSILRQAVTLAHPCHRSGARVRRGAQ